LLIDPSEQASTSPLSELKVQLYRQAERIATNRVVAGVHFPFDSTAGCALGLTLGEFVAHLAGGAAVSSRRFLPDPKKLADADFGLVLDLAGGKIVPKPIDDDAVLKVAPFALGPIAARTFRGFQPDPNHGALVWLWRQASREWLDAGEL
jgi:hypothetical protein